jgi:uncharacterized protein (TIGR03663 family)
MMNPKARLIPIVLIGIIGLVALVSRTYQLDKRPMHTDEAVHAIKFIELLDHGKYRYDPHEYHGPTLYYITLPIAWISGEKTGLQLTETTLRLVCVLASGLFFIPLFIIARHVSGGAAVGAAVAAAISPIIVYLSRYFIHEVYLVAFFFMFLVCAWRYVVERKWGWAVATGITLGLALATKETIALSFIGVFVALPIVFATEPEWRQKWREWLNWKHIGYASAAMLVVLVVFYSSFFTNFRGIWDFCTTYYYYLNRAGGQGHEKPWHYYFELLVFHRNGRGLTSTEVYVIVGALIAGICSFLPAYKDRPSRTFVKFLFVYSVALMGVYSCIPYKMPWLALNWMQPMTVLAGIGMAWILSHKSISLRVATVVVCLVAMYHMVYQVKRHNGRFNCDPRNPFVYSHTCTDFLQIPRMLKELASLHTKGNDMPVQVVCPEYWPLPWYTRELTTIGYWHKSPEGPLFDVVITSPDALEQFGNRLKGYERSTFWLRRHVGLIIYVKKDLWDKLIEKRSKASGS